jgi:hypothetical protein
VIIMGAMPTPAITLIDLPNSLCKGIQRRLPRHGNFKDLTGKRFGQRIVVGFAGFRGPFAAWLVRCQCGRTDVVAGA